MTRVGNDGTMSEGNTMHRPLAGVGGQIGMIITDLVVPVAGFYILRGFGIDAVLALILAGLPTVVAIGIRSIKQRKVGALGIFVLAILAGSVLLSFITGSPRFLLAREGWFTGAIGLAFLVSLRFRRPIAFTLARTMIETTKLADRLQPQLWDEMWEESARFRRAWRTSTVLWSAILIADALVRVIMAYALPVDIVPVITGTLWAVTFVVAQVAQHAYFKRIGLWQLATEYTRAEENSE